MKKGTLKKYTPAIFTGSAAVAFAVGATLCFVYSSQGQKEALNGFQNSETFAIYQTEAEVIQAELQEDYDAAYALYEIQGITAQELAEKRATLDDYTHYINSKDFIEDSILKNKESSYCIAYTDARGLTVPGALAAFGAAGFGFLSVFFAVEEKKSDEDSAES